MLKQISVLSLASLALCGCVSSVKYAGTGNLEELQRIGKAPTATNHTVKVSRIRLQAIEDTALTLGAQAGLAWRGKQINGQLAKKTQELDETYNFYAMLLKQNVLPPVLTEADYSLNLDSPNSIRLASKTYKIVSQARFVTAPPTWRDYLWMNYDKPDVPNNTLLPKSKDEQKVWNHYVTLGWNNGIHQANNIFSANLNRLIRDYQGMILYRKLYTENMVSAPFVAKTNLGITGDPSQININDRILRITALPQLNLKGNTWKPGIIPENNYQVRTSQKYFKNKKNKPIIHIQNDT